MGEGRRVGAVKVRVHAQWGMVSGEVGGSGLVRVRCAGMIHEG